VADIECLLCKNLCSGVPWPLSGSVVSYDNHWHPLETK